MAFDRELAYSRDEERPLSRTSERTAFIQRTYAHLAGAILAFIAIEAVLINVVPPERILPIMLGGWNWLLVLGAFMGASWLAQAWARSETSIGMQYLGLSLYVVAEAVIILPLLLIVHHYLAHKGGDRMIAEAGILTLMLFGGLTLSVFWTGKDYSPLRPILCIGGMIAFGVIICAILFGFSLGLFFSFAMVALLSGFILYETSQVMLHHRTDQHVAAALMLFSSIATLFWYILRIVMILNSRD